jgi:methylenetetrahydrofolate reductase (NADPH)
MIATLSANTTNIKHHDTRAITSVPKPANISFEFFPPKNPNASEQLWTALTRLAPLNPKFVSVTYGAGGTTRDTTLETVSRIKNETSLKPAAHLTCVGSSRAEVDELVKTYWNLGIKHIVALRGDAPNGGTYIPHPQGYAYAADLVAGIKKIGDFDISVAAFPDKHPTSPSLAFDIAVLKQKFDAGATLAITQYFFDVDSFLKYRDAAHRAGITQPIVPGILPIVNFEQVAKFSQLCGTHIPTWLRTLFAGLENDADTQKMIGVTVAAEQCRRLLDEGVSDFHFYTLNRADLTLAVCRYLGVEQSVLGVAA